MNEGRWWVLVKYILTHFTDQLIHFSTKIWFTVSVIHFSEFHFCLVHNYWTPL
uniref:Uncharacterized protein n=1 Tax=Anguilla anguilla TaxID=7936 RepID=A0A0E9XE99_ANGAN